MLTIVLIVLGCLLLQKYIQKGSQNKVVYFKEKKHHTDLKP